LEIYTDSRAGNQGISSGKAWFRTSTLLCCKHIQDGIVSQLLFNLALSAFLGDAIRALQSVIGVELLAVFPLCEPSASDVSQQSFEQPRLQLLSCSSTNISDAYWLSLLSHGSGLAQPPSN
jgi:hypothetical protein